MLGLTEAAERYDESRTEPFLSFAEHRIRGAVLDELRRGDMLPRRVRQVARKISNTIRELENAGEAPSEQRIADSLGVPDRAVRRPRAASVSCGVNEPPGRLNFLAGSASLLVAEWTTLPHGQG